MQGIIVCPACDLVHRLDSPTRARCSRCDRLLRRGPSTHIDTALALTVSALVLLVISNLYPLVSIDFNGSSRTATLLGATAGLYRQGDATLAALVCLTTVIAPLTQVVSLLYVLTPLTRKRRAPAHERVFRLLNRVREWTFVEVFMLGALVPGVALAAYGLSMLTLVALANVASPEQIWLMVEQSRS